MNELLKIITEKPLIVSEDSVDTFIQLRVASTQFDNSSLARERADVVVWCYA